MSKDNLLRWNLTNIYPSVDSREFVSDIQKAYQLAEELKRKSKEKDSILSILHVYDELSAVVVNLSSYAYASFSVDTANPKNLAALSKTEKAETAFSDACTVMTFHLAKRTEEFDKPELEKYQLFLKEIKTDSEHMMSLEEEALANEMLQVSSSSWSRLQESITSSIKDGDKTLIQLRGLAMSPDRAVRKDAYERELKILEANETALAASLNGVKGTALLLEKRRGWLSPIDRSISSSRITRKALDVLISALEESLPMFREYLQIKAKLLGLDKMDWYDLFAPVGEESMSFTFEEAKELVVSSYRAFSEEVGAFIKNAFDSGWIDAEAHEGKVGGAYDIAFPLVGESRVMMNWEGSYDSVTTLAHELGHAYHDSVVKDLPQSLADYPMTLAETASIFGEQIIFQSVLERADKNQQLGLIEQFVQSACQVCVDILSRYYFEESAFEARKDGEVTAEEYSRLMLSSQERTYGDGLGMKHKYMWAVKSHYYSEAFSFYNYPYAFGQLFALGLYGKKDKMENFPELYKTVLSMTGRAEAREVALLAGCDIESKDFWLEGLGVIKSYIEKMKDF